MKHLSVTAVQRGTYDGEPVAERIVLTDTFIRTGKTWQAVACEPNRQESLSAASERPVCGSLRSGAV